MMMMSPAQSEQVKTKKLMPSHSPDKISLQHNKPLPGLIRPVQAMMIDRKQSQRTKRTIDDSIKNREYKFQMKNLSVGHIMGEIRTNIQQSTGNRLMSPESQMEIKQIVKKINKRIFIPL